MAQTDPFISLLLTPPTMTVQPVTAVQPHSPGRVIGLPVRPVAFTATGQLPITQPTVPVPTIPAAGVEVGLPDEIYTYSVLTHLHEGDEPSFTFVAISKERLIEAGEIYLLRIWTRDDWNGEYDDKPSVVLSAISERLLTEEFAKYLVEHRRDEDHIDDKEFNEEIEALDIEVEDQYFNSAYIVDLVKAKMIR